MKFTESQSRVEDTATDLKPWKQANKNFSQTIIVKLFTNKIVLLPEWKRHPARRVASSRSAALSPDGEGVPLSRERPVGKDGATPRQ